MRFLNKGRRKSKNHPEKICFCCGVKIKNKFRNARYCIECEKDITVCLSRVHGLISYVKKSFPDYNIRCKLTVTKKKQHHTP